MKRFAPIFSLALIFLTSKIFALTANFPLVFEAGQKSSDFFARGENSAFSINADHAQILLRRADGKTGALQMQFVGAKSSAQISGESEQTGKINYLVGDKSQWRVGVPTFAQVRVNEIYPGVNLIYYGNGQKLEYDFNLSPGAKPETIKINFSGAEKISVNERGQLVVRLNGGEMIQEKPIAFQIVHDERREIQIAYKISGANQIEFAIKKYDHTLPLVIDPVLSYSTYFGGNRGDNAHAVALDANGFIYVAGETLSTVISNGIPGGALTNQFQGGHQKGDAFIAKLDNNGTNLIYFTYLGGNEEEVALGLAVDNSGDAFVTGYTDSTNFPTANALFPQIASKFVQGAYLVDAFVSELNPSGSGLIYSTYLGGDSPDIGSAIAVDTDGTAYIAGYTYSTNFPVTANAFQTRLACTNSLYINANAFVTAIAPGGNALNYSSFLGGTNFDEATSIALDPAHSVYVAGFSTSTNFPTTNFLSASKYLNGSIKKTSRYDAFVTKFLPGCAGVVYSTFLGGTNDDFAYGIAADSVGNAYVVGASTSTNFPNTVNNFGFDSFVRTNPSTSFPATNAFLTQIQWNGTAANIGYSIIFGGYGNDFASGLALDAAGDVFIVGSASSTNFPVTRDNLFGSLHPTNSGPWGSSDVFVTAFSNNLSGVIYSAYLGGKESDNGEAIAIDAAANAYVVGQTLSTDFPVFNARQTVRAGTNDAFLAKILFNVPLPQLTVNQSAKNVSVSWAPAPMTEMNAQTYGVETSADYFSTNWTTIAQPPVWTGTNFIYNFDPTNRARFFRFKKY